MDIQGPPAVINIIQTKNVSYIDLCPARLSGCVAGSRHVTPLEAEAYCIGQTVVLCRLCS